MDCMYSCALWPKRVRLFYTPTSFHCLLWEGVSQVTVPPQDFLNQLQRPKLWVICWQYMIIKMRSLCNWSNYYHHLQKLATSELFMSIIEVNAVFPEQAQILLYKCKNLFLKSSNLDLSFTPLCLWMDLLKSFRCPACFHCRAPEDVTRVIRSGSQNSQTLETF